MELVIFIGLQGAGKTTFYHTHFAATHTHISKDHFPNVSNRDERQYNLIQAALDEGHSVVLDNTNATVESRIAPITQGRSAGATVIGYYFASQLEACLERNSRRKGKARVPDIALYHTIDRLTLPTHAEGFDRLYYVRIGEDGGYIVDDWQVGE